jgi:hypothetical protein
MQPKCVDPARADSGEGLKTGKLVPDNDVDRGSSVLGSPIFGFDVTGADACCASVARFNDECPFGASPV